MVVVVVVVMVMVMVMGVVVVVVVVVVRDGLKGGEKASFTHINFYFDEKFLKVYKITFPRFSQRTQWFRSLISGTKVEF